MPFRIFIGYDSTQDIAYRVLRFSLLRHASIEIDIRPLVLPEIMARHRWHRPHDPQQSTEFTYTRFLVPYLCGFEGTALFMDSDMLCLGDIAPLAKENLSECALRVVKHDQRPTSTIKMGGQDPDVLSKEKLVEPHVDELLETSRLVERERGEQARLMAP